MPVLCGGTGLYIKAIVDHVQYSEEITSDEALREQLRQLAQKEGNEALWQRLKAIDPQTAERIHPNNVGRVIRAIEVMEVSGRSIREHEADSLREACPYHVVEIGLRYHDREKLYERINRRVDKMVEMGLLEEVHTARQSGLTATAAQAIGCKELYGWLVRMTDLALKAKRPHSSQRCHSCLSLLEFHANVIYTSASLLL